MIVAFDVDLTLIDKNNKINYNTLDLMRWFINNNDRVIVWSGGGIDWAERWVRHLGLQDKVQVAMKTQENAKALGIDIAVDDEFVTLGKVNIKINPL